MGVVGRNPLVFRWRRQPRAKMGDAFGTVQRQRHRWRDFVGGAQRVDPQRPPLRHIKFRAVLVGRKRVISRIALHPLVQMQKIRVIQLHRARMGVDERRHRLQGDEKPEHQKSVKSVRHGRIQEGFG